MKAVYCDNAATTLIKPNEVSETVYQALTNNQFGNPARGAHDYSLNSFREVERVREQIKQLLKATKQYEVVFTSNATSALNILLKGLFVSDMHLITTTWEHNAVLRPLYQMEKTGVVVDFIASFPTTGQLDYTEFSQKLRADTKAVIVNHASNVTGNVVDLEWLKNFCVTHDLLLILDISQSFGQLPFDLSDEKIDAVCFTGHKSLYGPTGVGGICFKKELQIKPLIAGGDGVFSFEKEMVSEYPTRLESGTLNIPGILGLGAGLHYISEQTLLKIHHKLLSLSETFMTGVRQLNNIVVYGDQQQERIPVVSLNIGDVSAGIVSNLLWEDYRIATRAGFHCAPLMHQALRTDQQGAVRFSFSSFNTSEEIEYCIEALKEISQG